MANNDDGFGCLVIVFVVAASGFGFWYLLGPMKPEDVLPPIKDQKEISIACHAAFTCSRYGKAVHECAAAGNLAQCVNIKMGEAGSDAAYGCGFDGHSLWPSGATRWQCFFDDPKAFYESR